MRQILLVPIEDVENAWPRVRDFLQKGIDTANGEFEIEDVYTFLWKGYWQLWIGVDEGGRIFGAGTTEFVSYPMRKLLRLVLLGGEELKHFVDNFSVFEQFALHNGADGIETWCRKGLTKMYESLGYKVKYQVMVKNLIGG